MLIDSLANLSDHNLIYLLSHLEICGVSNQIFVWKCLVEADLGPAEQLVYIVFPDNREFSFAECCKCGRCLVNEMKGCSNRNVL